MGGNPKPDANSDHDLIAALKTKIAELEARVSELSTAINPLTSHSAALCYPSGVVLTKAEEHLLRIVMGAHPYPIKTKDIHAAMYHAVPLTVMPDTKIIKVLVSKINAKFPLGKIVANNRSFGYALTEGVYEKLTGEIPW
jgi:hypothetical protein